MGNEKRIKKEEGQQVRTSRVTPTQIEALYRLHDRTSSNQRPSRDRFAAFESRGFSTRLDYSVTKSGRMKASGRGWKGKWWWDGGGYWVGVMKSEGNKHKVRGNGDSDSGGLMMTMMMMTMMVMVMVE
ncbi:hypothetical protein HZH68_014039 [Vespula germanica]|uniref:Uncharacterized protein n=1 Tax=Vespula germanica TaxID=30212 RepID=A0A834MVX1_VESGE|nr:hypothetical protein HZH68_014039 [Vespula germanica]